MKHPWHVWLFFGIGLAVVAPVMGRLTVKVLELDYAEAVARRQAEREEVVGRALWRMDARLSPILAQEAARPAAAYEAAYDDAPAPGGKGKGKKAARPLSPLLEHPPEFVWLHFELHGERLISPQCPSADEQAAAAANGVSPELLTTFTCRANELESAISPARLIAQLPGDAWNEALPPPQRPQQNPGRQPQVVASNYPEERLQNRGPPPSVPSDNSQPTSSNSADLQQQVAQQAVPFNPPPQQQQAFNTPPNGRSINIDNDLAGRNSAYQSLAQNAYVQQRLHLPKTVSGPAGAAAMQEGLFRPVWAEGNLLLARRVRRGDEVFVQGCWLDWPALERMLREEVSDLLTDFQLVPVLDPQMSSLSLSRVLATLPVQVALPTLAVEPPGWTPVRVALAAAWAGIALAGIAAAITLGGVVALSERRAAFVSAVTHELRTPLTTFRMYAEMLAEGMVPDPAVQRKYLETLRTEADRLAHLVENVLQYARLERGRPGKAREVIRVDALAARMAERSAERARQAGMELVVSQNSEISHRQLRTDPAAVEQIVFNLVDNACKYAVEAADKRIELHFGERRGKLEIQVRDFGPGIPPQGRRRLFAPFSKSVHEAAESAPGVGLGLALSRRLAEALGGSLHYESSPPLGAVFILRLPTA